MQHYLPFPFLVWRSQQFAEHFNIPQQRCSNLHFYPQVYLLKCLCPCKRQVLKYLWHIACRTYLLQASDLGSFPVGCCTFNLLGYSFALAIPSNRHRQRQFWPPGSINTTANIPGCAWTLGSRAGVGEAPLPPSKSTTEITQEQAFLTEPICCSLFPQQLLWTSAGTHAQHDWWNACLL